MAKIVEPDRIQDELRNALQLLTKRKQQNACVLLEDKTTEKFVQFGHGPKLVLDLPLKGLSEAEAERARHTFAEFGAVESRALEAPDVRGKPISRKFEVLQMDFGTDADNAFSAALRVFQNTYQLKEVTYVLHEV